jgi:hypothetical protein
MNLDDLVKAVEAGKRVTIPTPHPHARNIVPPITARILGYVEGYVVMRHKGAAPFVCTVKQVLDMLRALQAEGRG